MNIKNRSFPFNIYSIAIFCLIGIVVFSNFLWLKLDEYPIAGHDLLGIFPALQLYGQIKGLENSWRLYSHPFGIYYGNVLNYPPLSFLTLALYYLFFGPHGQLDAMVNSFYIAVTLLLVFLIGKKICNAGIGLLAAFTLSSFPIFIALSRVYWIEFTLMTYVCLDIYFLIKTDLFENTRYSLLFGIAFALSLLQKAEFIIFLFGPFTLILCKSGILKDSIRLRWSKRLKNFLFMLFCAVTISSFWLFFYGEKVAIRMLSVFSSPIEVGKLERIQYWREILSHESLTYYFRSITALICDVYTFLLFLSLVMCIFLILKNIHRFWCAFILLWFLVPLSVFTFTHLRIKYPTHILSLFPAVALLISMFIHFIRNKIIKIIVLTLIFFNATYLHLYSFIPLGIEKRGNLFFTKPGYTIPLLDTFGLPRKEYLESTIEEINDFLNSDGPKERKFWVLVVFKRMELKNCIFHYYNFIGKNRFNFFSTHYKMVQDISEPDYLIIERSGNETLNEILSREYDSWELERKNFKAMFKNGINDFEPIRTFKILGGDTSLFVYKKKGLF